MLLEPAQALKRIFDRVDAFLKDDLLRGMVELLTGKPAPMRQRPVAASAVDATVPEQEGKKLLALSPKIVSRRLASARQIPDCLMSRVGRPDPCQFAGTVQTRSVTASRRFVLLVSGSAPERPPSNRTRAPSPGDKARIPSARLQSRRATGRTGSPVS